MSSIRPDIVVFNGTTHIISAGAIGPPGPKGDPGEAGVHVRQSAALLAAGQAYSIDSIPANTIRAVKWLVSMESVDGRTHQYEVAAHMGIAEPAYVKYAVLGQKLAVSITVASVAGDMHLSVQNNEPVSVSISVLRFGMTR